MAEQSRGDRFELSVDELGLLENKIIPTAIRWLQRPSLRSYGAQTLAYWGEFDVLSKDEARRKRERDNADRR